MWAAHPIIPHALIGPSLVVKIPDRGNPHSRVAIVGPVELCAPYLDDVRQALEEDALYPFVQLRHPLFEIGVALEVQAIDLHFSGVRCQQIERTSRYVDIPQPVFCPIDH